MDSMSCSRPYNSSFEDNKLVVYFVHKSEENRNESFSCSDVMKEVAKYLRDYITDDRIKWISESETIDLISRECLTKRDIFVLDEFDGQVFEDLQSTEALIVGPRCLLVCLLDCIPIPFGKSPVFLTCMRNLYICCSGFNLEEKNKMKNLILYMGGHYVKELNRNANYLISNTIKSPKYEQAVLHSIPIMHMDWISAIWEAGNKNTVSATDSQFDKYKLPVFYEINISTSGLNNDVKEKIMKIITENGGNFQRIFKSSQTDILITTRDNINSDKFKAAVKYKKDVLLPEWIFDSFAKGVALPMKNYKITSLKVSTPTKSEQFIPDFSVNCTQISNCDQSSLRQSIQINETVGEQRKKLVVANVAKTYQDVLKEICPQQAKKAGTFLDGCCICLSGFTSDEKEKLNKILNFGGATRYNEINDNVTHIIIGRSIASEFNSWGEYGAYVVTLDWLLESINLKQPANELNFRAKLQIQREPEAPSPQSKKSLRSLNHSFKKPEVPVKRLDFIGKENEGFKSTSPSSADEDQENNFLAQYSQEKNLSKAIQEFPSFSQSKSKLIEENKRNDLMESNFTSEQSDITENLDFFDGFTIYVDKNYDEEMYSQAIIDCETANGKVVKSTYRDKVDYVIVSAEIPIDITAIPVKSSFIVNSIWMEDAIRTNERVSIEYFHKPIPIAAAKKPLTGMTIVISAYDNSERLFLQYLIIALGAVRKDAYTRKEKPLLICPSPTTDKYNAALKWNFPVVKAEWLLLCSETGCIAPLQPYLVGDAKEGDYLNDIKKISPKLNASMSTPKTSKPKNCQFNDIETPIQNPDEYTPLRHKRISELAGPSEKRFMTTPEPKTPTYSPLIDDIDEYLKDMSQDNVRELCKSVLIDALNQNTPEAERLKKLTKTPSLNSPSTPQGIPEFCRTPQFRKRMMDGIEKRWHLSIKKLKPNTPIEEIKNRLWHEMWPAEFIATCKHFEKEMKICTPNISMKGKLSRQTSVDLMSPNTSHNNSSNCGESNENASPAVKRLKEFLKNCEEQRTKCSFKSKINDNNQIEEETQGLPPQRFESEMFNTERMVGWSDPSDFTVARRTLDAMKYKGTPRFNISVITEQDKLEISNQIKQLKGEICENLKGHDPTCTHIVCEKPNRGEKLLSGISSGKWILTLNYITDSCTAGYFLDEELYEWGNPKALNLPVLKRREQAIASSSYYWRQKISSNPSINGAFSGQKVLLYIPDLSQQAFISLITAGYGEILKSNPPYSKEIILKATHCYVDDKDSWKNHIDRNLIKTLLDHNICVLTLKAINSYLTCNPEGDLSEFSYTL